MCRSGRTFKLIPIMVGALTVERYVLAGAACLIPTLKRCPGADITVVCVGYGAVKRTMESFWHRILTMQRMRSSSLQTSATGARASTTSFTNAHGRAQCAFPPWLPGIQGPALWRARMLSFTNRASHAGSDSPVH